MHVLCRLRRAGPAQRMPELWWRARSASHSAGTRVAAGVVGREAAGLHSAHSLALFVGRDCGVCPACQRHATGATMRKRAGVAAKVDSFRQIFYYRRAFMLVPQRFFEAVFAVLATCSVLLGIDFLFRSSRHIQEGAS